MALIGSASSWGFCGGSSMSCAGPSSRTRERPPHLALLDRLIGNGTFHRPASPGFSSLSILHTPDSRLQTPASPDFPKPLSTGSSRGLESSSMVRARRFQPVGTRYVLLISTLLTSGLLPLSFAIFHIGLSHGRISFALGKHQRHNDTKDEINNGRTVGSSAEANPEQARPPGRSPGYLAKAALYSSMTARKNNTPGFVPGSLVR